MFVMRYLRRLLGLIAVVIAVMLIALVGFRIAAYLREVGTPEQLAPATGLRVPTSRGELFVQWHGEKNQLPVILIHGAGAWSGFWDDIAKYLANAAYQVIAVDLPPFGFSERSPANAYTVADQAARLSEMMNALKLPKAIIVGHSFGARAVIETVMRYPDQLRGVLLIAGALGLPDGDDPPASTVAPWILRQPVVMEFVIANTATNPLLTRVLTAMMLNIKAGADDRQVAILQRPLGLRGSTAALAAWVPTLLTTDLNALSAIPVNYRKITTPTRLVWGREDKITPIVQGERLAKLIPGAVLMPLDGLGHIPHIEDPPRTAAAILAAVQALAMSGQP